jgi:energy-coupling factor transporter ATP-binding protein EcfA2
MAKYCKSLFSSSRHTNTENERQSISGTGIPSQAPKIMEQQMKDITFQLTDKGAFEDMKGQLRPCVVLLNGYPGVGKATIAKALQAALPPNVPSRLLERHTVLDLCDTVNPGCPDTMDRIWNESLKALCFSPDERTIIITTDSLFQDLDGMYRYGGHSMIAWTRSVPFFAINLHCDAKTNEKRLCSEERKVMTVYGRNKLIDAEELHDIRSACPYIDLKTLQAYRLSLDISEASVEDSMERILEFLKYPY